MNEMDKKLFLGWLEEEEKKKQKELEPFYKLRERRDEAGMNSYGCGTPHDYVLLEEVYAI